MVTTGAIALCLGCGIAGKSELCTSIFNHTLPALAPSFSCPNTTAHLTCVGHCQIKYIRFKCLCKQHYREFAVFYLTSCNTVKDFIVGVESNADFVSVIYHFICPLKCFLFICCGEINYFFCENVLACCCNIIEKDFMPVLDQSQQKTEKFCTVYFAEQRCLMR